MSRYWAAPLSPRQQQLEDAVRRILRRHGLTLMRLAHGGYSLEDRGHNRLRSLRPIHSSLVQLVDYLKPILQDDELFKLYV